MDLLQIRGFRRLAPYIPPIFARLACDQSSVGDANQGAGILGGGITVFLISFSTAKKKELLLVYVLLKCSTCSLQKMGIFARKAVPFVLHIEPRRVVVSHVKNLQMPSPERYPHLNPEF
jgi:hypothetical protein